MCATVSITFKPTVEVLRPDDTAAIRTIADRADPTRLLVPHYIARPLLDKGAVRRVRNPDLWDAWVLAVLRQNTSETTSARMYRTLCQTHGETVSTRAGPALLLPTPAQVLSLTDGTFTTLRMRHKRRPLRAAAEAYLKHNHNWTHHTPHQLLAQLQTVPYVSEWTAKAIVSDLTNDFSIHPFTDHAIRTWGDDFAIASKQPRDHTEFVRLWKTLTGEQLSTLTLLTMTWGRYHGEATDLWASQWWRGRWRWD